MKGKGTCGSEERNVEIYASFSEVSQNFLYIALMSTEREVTLPCLVSPDIHTSI